MFVVGVSCALVLSSCKTSEKATGGSTSEVGMEMNLDVRGHRFYTLGNYDSASAILHRLLKMDPENKIALRDLGNMHFELAVLDKDEKSPPRVEHLQASRRYYTDLERLGEHDAELLDRLCEVSLNLGDNKSFLTYAKKSADWYPFDRQYYNLGLAYFNIGDYEGAISVEKAAIEKFRTSPYLSSYYRQLGHAYMKVDRDQTAERTFEEGMRIINMRLVSNPSQDDYRRLADDRIAILLSLKRLYKTYQKEDKLNRVNRELQEAGYSTK
jgi:tetratricopeptide (TPR) repeat protein